MTEKLYDIEGKRYRLLRNNEKFSPTRCVCLVEVDNFKIELGDAIVFVDDGHTHMGVVYDFCGDHPQVGDLDGDHWSLNPEKIRKVYRNSYIVWEVE